MYFKFKYHVTCLHPNRGNNTTRPYQEPAIVERRRGRGRAAGWLYGWLYKSHR